MTTVADDGMYWFTDLKPGTYTISEESRENWLAISPSSGEHNVTVTSGQSLTGLDFGSQFHAEDLVAIELRATNLAGAPISRARIGETIIVQAFAEDLRALPEGVFAAYLDVFYDVERATVSGPIVFGAGFGEGQSGDTSTSALLDEVGGFSGESTSSENSALVFSVPFRATSLGQLAFFADAADALPNHEVLLFGQTKAVSPGAVSFIPVTLQIVAPRWRNRVRIPRFPC